MILPSGEIGVSFDGEYSIEIDPEAEEITVWNGNNGRKHSIEDLAPFTDDE